MLLDVSCINDTVCLLPLIYHYRGVAFRRSRMQNISQRCTKVPLSITARGQVEHSVVAGCLSRGKLVHEAAIMRNTDIQLSCKYNIFSTYLSRKCVPVKFSLLRLFKILSFRFHVFTYSAFKSCPIYTHLTSLHLILPIFQCSVCSCVRISPK